jgi:hypothetical protein
MKARIRIPTIAAPMTLCANFTPERLAVAMAALASCGVEPRAVERDELGLTVGALAGLDPKIPASAPAVHTETECLVFCGFAGDLLDRVLKALREASLQVSCKAMLTETNRTWTIDALIGELSREHEAMTGRKA